MMPSERYLFIVFSVWSGLLLLSTASGHLHSPDGEINYRTVRSLATTGGYAVTPLPGGSFTRRGRDGNEYPQYGPLQPLLAVPFYWMGTALAGIVPPSWLTAQQKRLTSTVSFYRGWNGPSRGRFTGLYPVDHAERVTRSVVSLFNSVITWLTVLLVLRWCRKYHREPLKALIVPFTYLVATYAWPHSRPFYTEVLATFWILWAVYLADSLRNLRGKDRFFTACGVGVSAGLAILTRLDSIVAAGGIASLAVLSLRNAPREGASASAVPAVLAGVFCFAAVSAVVPIQNFLRYGSLLATGYSDQPEGIRFSIPFLDSLGIYFLSPGKGVFWYSPPLLLALFAWWVLALKNGRLAFSLGLILAGYILVVGRWQNLGGWCWGPRHLFQTTLFFLFPLPWVFDRNFSEPFRRSVRITFLVSLVLGVAVQVPGVLVDFMWPLDRRLRLVPVPEQTALVLSAEFYGPLLHLKAWRLDPEPDWLLADLWKSGEWGARCVSAVAWGAFLAASLLLAAAVIRCLRRSDGQVASDWFPSSPTGNGTDPG